MSVDVYYNFILFLRYNDQLLARAEFSVPLSLASRRCGYKYVLLNQKDQYEEIIEYQSIWGDHVNRCLFIKQEYISENSKFAKSEHRQSKTWTGNAS